MPATKWQSFSDINQLCWSQPVRDWLTHSGSFMARIKAHGIVDAKIQVLSEGWQWAESEERRVLNLEPRQYVWVREVLIHSGDKQWMWARTVFPQATICGKEQRFKTLKNRALGTMLFQKPDVTRSEFMFASLPYDCRWHLKIRQKIFSEREVMLARRSMFAIKEKQLLLFEVFLPDMLAVMT